MAYKLIVEREKTWQKDCSAIPKDQLKKIFQHIKGLAKDPWAGNVQVRQLKNYDVADFRLRCGDYRVLFNKDEEEKVIRLLRVLHRSKLY
jgi:mRNA interferase RelE/StbE